jgi:hypothetical protein
MNRSTDRSSERGSVLILVALSSVALLSIGALSIDVSFTFDLKNRMAAVADSAAKSAAYEVKRGNGTNLVLFAQGEVQRAQDAGLIPSGVTMDAHLCTAVGATCSAAYTGTGYVEVILSKTQSTFFAPIFGMMNLVPTARAVAGIANPASCFTSMHNLELGTSTISGPNCAVKVGGNLIGDTPQATIPGSVMISGTGTCTGKSCDPGGNFGDWTSGQPAPTDPYSSVTKLTPPACAPATTNVLAAGCYTTIPDMASFTFGAGVFFVAGNWDMHNNNVINAPNGTLIYLLPAGSITGNQATFNIKASNTITNFEGIAMYGEPGSSLSFKNGVTFNIDGALALVNTTFDSKNNVEITSPDHCAVAIFNDFFTKSGTGSVDASGCAKLFTGAKYLDVALAE